MFRRRLGSFFLFLAQIAFLPPVASGWQSVFPDPQSGRFTASTSELPAAIDGANDVIALGTLDTVGPGLVQGLVVKYAGGTGAELWRTVFHGTGPQGFNRPLGRALVGGSDVVVAGNVDNGNGSAFGVSFFVARFSGATGTELWPREIDYGFARAVAVDGDGNVVAAGQTRDAPASGPRPHSSWSN